MIDAKEWVPLVWRVVREMRMPGEDEAVLFSDGSAALMVACRRYKPEKAKFITYAWLSIKFGIMSGRVRGKLIRTPQGKTAHKIRLFSEIHDGWVRGRAAELARECPMPDLDKTSESLVGPLYGRIKEIVVKRFGLDGMGVRTLDELAVEYGVTRERVRQIEMKGIRKLQDAAARKAAKGAK